MISRVTFSALKFEITMHVDSLFIAIMYDCIHHLSFSSILSIMDILIMSKPACAMVAVL